MEAQTIRGPQDNTLFFFCLVRLLGLHYELANATMVANSVGPLSWKNDQTRLCVTGGEGDKGCAGNKGERNRC